jgi:hypothetical protein
VESGSSRALSGISVCSCLFCRVCVVKAAAQRLLAPRGGFGLIGSSRGPWLSGGAVGAGTGVGGWRPADPEGTERRPRELGCSGLHSAVAHETPFRIRDRRQVKEGEMGAKRTTSLQSGCRLRIRSSDRRGQAPQALDWARRLEMRRRAGQNQAPSTRPLVSVRGPVRIVG